MFYYSNFGNASDAFKVLPVITYIFWLSFFVLFFFAFNFCYWKLDLKHVLKDSISQNRKIKCYRQSILKFKFLPLFETLWSNLFINFVVYNFRILVRNIYFESSNCLETITHTWILKILRIPSYRHGAIQDNFRLHR